MAKRFTATEKWEDLWFSELPKKYKLFWLYLLDKCDNAGVWEKNFKIANFLLDEEFNEKETKAVFKDKIFEFNSNKWFVPKFIEFQYGTLNENSNPHKSVIDKLTKYGLLENGVFKGISTLEEVTARVKDKEEDKAKDKAKDKDIGKCLFKNSVFYNKEVFERNFNSNPDYIKYDWEHFYEAIKNWSASNNQMKSDWIATAYTWARKDGDKYLRKENIVRLSGK